MRLWIVDVDKNANCLECADQGGTIVILNLEIEGELIFTILLLFATLYF